ALLLELPRRLEIPSVLIKGRQTSQNTEELRRVPSLPTQLPGAGIGVSHLRGSPPLGDLQRSTQRNVERKFALGALRRLGEGLEHFQPRGEVTDRFHIGRALDGFLTRLPPVANGLLPEARCSIVMRQQLRLRLSRLGEPLF